ncbi:MAG: hypothetical protein U0744_12700 [Gemmataceae bacterium]
MKTDMVVALGSATIQQQTLLGRIDFGIDPALLDVCRLDPSYHSEEDSIALRGLSLPLAGRQSHGVLGCRFAGQWGLTYGCNDANLAIGVSRWSSRFADPTLGFSGPDLVRLALQRTKSAQQAIEFLTESIETHGQFNGPSGDDTIFLIADSREALVLEAAGKHWALQECLATRAVSDTALIRQDWRRLAPGLADMILEQDWHRDDGSKIDFCGSLCQRVGHEPMRRWSKATMALAMQERAIDPWCMRQLLAEHFEACEPILSPGSTWFGSGVFALDSDKPAIFWHCPDPSRIPLYFPLFVDANLPGMWVEGDLPRPARRRFGDGRLSHIVEMLQPQFDRDAEEFAEAATRMDHAERAARGREIMEKHLELWTRECRKEQPRPVASRRIGVDVTSFVAE